MLCGIAWNALSDALARTAPAQAIALDPWNDRAALEILKKKIAKVADDGATRESVIASATRAAAASPIESRFPSSAAVAYLYDEQPEPAIELAADALQLDSTDHFAVNIMARSLLADGDATGAIEVLFRGLRRNPSNAVNMIELLKALTATEEGRTAFGRALDRETLWALPAVRALAEQEGGYEIVYNILSARNLAPEERDGDIDRLIANQFISSGKFALGFRHFLQQVPEGREVSYVFNPHFEHEPLFSPWDWHIRSSTEATVERRSSDQSRIRIAFRNKPVARIGLSQYVAVPPGAAVFSTEIRGSGFRAGKPLELSLDCVSPFRSRLATIEVPEGSYDWRRLEVAFENPNAVCRYGRINMRGTGVQGSFRDRYEGVVELETVEITRSKS